MKKATPFHFKLLLLFVFVAVIAGYFFQSFTGMQIYQLPNRLINQPSQTNLPSATIKYSTPEPPIEQATVEKGEVVKTVTEELEKQRLATLTDIQRAKNKIINLRNKLAAFTDVSEEIAALNTAKNKLESYNRKLSKPIGYKQNTATPTDVANTIAEYEHDVELSDQIGKVSTKIQLAKNFDEVAAKLTELENKLTTNGQYTELTSQVHGLRNKIQGKNSEIKSTQNQKKLKTATNLITDFHKQNKNDVENLLKKLYKTSIQNDAEAENLKQNTFQLLLYIYAASQTLAPSTLSLSPTTRKNSLVGSNSDPTYMLPSSGVIHGLFVATGWRDLPALNTTQTSELQRDINKVIKIMSKNRVNLTFTNQRLTFSDYDAIEDKDVLASFVYTWLILGGIDVEDFDYVVISGHRGYRLSTIPGFPNPRTHNTILISPVPGLSYEYINPLKTFTHELGHAFGSRHSNFLFCMDDLFQVTYSENCLTYEYGDVFNVMGLGPLSHYNIVLKKQLGWAEVTEVTRSGTYKILANQLEAKQLKYSKGLKIPIWGRTLNSQYDYIYLQYAKPFTNALFFNNDLLYASVPVSIEPGATDEKSGGLLVYLVRRNDRTGSLPLKNWLIDTKPLLEFNHYFGIQDDALIRNGETWCSDELGFDLCLRFFESAWGEATVNVNFEGTPGELIGPDLVTSFSWNCTPVSRELMRVNFTVQNIGETPSTPTEITFRYVISVTPTAGRVLNKDAYRIPALLPGENYSEINYFSNRSYNAGAQWVMSKIDPENTVYETNEENNRAYMSPFPCELCDGMYNGRGSETEAGCDSDNDNYCDANMLTIGQPAACPLGGGDQDDANPSIH